MSNEFRKSTIIPSLNKKIIRNKSSKYTHSNLINDTTIIKDRVRCNNLQTVIHNDLTDKPSGIKRHGPLCYLISAIQSLRYLNLDNVDHRFNHIINNIKNGNLNYIFNYFNFPYKSSSARDALYTICKTCDIEITEYIGLFINDIQNDNIEINKSKYKNILLISYYDNFARKQNEDLILSFKSSIRIKDNIFNLKSAIYYSPSSKHYITVIFKNDDIFILNDDKIYKLNTTILSTKIYYYNDNYYCESAIYE